LDNALILLDKDSIATHLKDRGLCIPYQLHVFDFIDSTNRYLKDLTPGALLDVCCAEQQTQGKGRFGRHWHSPFGENIYCSSRWNLSCDLSHLSGLSLVTSLAILKTVKEVTAKPNIALKWPNDILWQHKKLCGSLIELCAQPNGQVQAIIGIGLNVNSDTLHHPLPDKAWCSLYELTAQHYDRNRLIAHLISNLHLYLQKLQTSDFTVFMDEWRQADYLLDKEITLTQAQTVLTGVASGVNHLGQLIITNQDGVHYLSSGDTTLRSLSRA
jgi:BirA family biotin operon repressor/biotin-[acetyl-CoA-carboxylase] ligase